VGCKKILTVFSPAQKPASRGDGLTARRPDASPQRSSCVAQAQHRAPPPPAAPPRRLAARLLARRASPRSSPPSRPLCSAHRPARTGTAAPGGRSQQRAAGSLQPARTGVGVAVVVVALVVSLCFIVSRLPVSRGRHSWVAAPSSLQVISSTTAS